MAIEENGVSSNAASRVALRCFSIGHVSRTASNYTTYAAYAQIHTESVSPLNSLAFCTSHGLFPHSTTSPPATVTPHVIVQGLFCHHNTF